MQITKLPLEGAFLIEPQLFSDDRGFFFEWFNKEKFEAKTNVSFDIKQVNFSRSSKGVLRGLHFQTQPMAQAKLIAAPKGEILDVIVDLRNSSKTFGSHYKVVLSEENKKQLYIPEGFAHGFLTLSETAEIMYGINKHYSPTHDSGIRFDSDALNIDWGVTEDELVLSKKDISLEEFTNSKKYF